MMILISIFVLDIFAHSAFLLSGGDGFGKIAIIFRTDNTPCLSASAKSTPASSVVKIWPVKSLSDQKNSNYSPPRCIIHNLVHPNGNVE